MITSDQVAQSFAAQNQMFMGQGMYAQQIGVTSPGAHGQQPFSYANTGVTGASTGAGDRFAGGVMSAGGALATAAGVGAGFLPMLGGAFKAFTPFTDPLSMGMAGWNAGGSMGLGLMGRLGMAGGAAAVPMGVGMLASHAAHSFIHGGQEQQRIQNTLGNNFQFYNPSARGGQGFTRDDAMAIGNQIRQLSAIPDMMTSVEELTRMIPKLKQTGMMQGVKDASEFNRRFTEAIRTIRDVSKVIGTTMEEATQFFAQSRSAGFLGKGDQLKNVMNAQFTSGVTGMSMGSVMQMQRFGADMATQMGGSRRLGAQAVTNIAQTIGSAQREGRLREGLIEDLTGMEGSEGVNAAAQQMTQVTTQLAQTPGGRMIIAGMMKIDENGKAVLDEGKVRALKENKLSYNQLKQMGMGLSRKEKLIFNTRASDLSLQFAGQVGPEGMGQFWEGIAEEKGLKSQYGDEAVTKLLQMQGVNANQSDLMRQMIGTQGTGDDRKKVLAALKMRESQIKEQFSPHAIWEKFKKRNFGAFHHIEQAGAEAFTEISKTMDDVLNDVVGRHVVTMSKEGMKTAARAFTTTGKKDMEELFSRASRAPSAGGASAVGRFAGSVAGAGSLVLGLAAMGDDGARGAAGIASSVTGWTDSYLTEGGRRERRMNETLKAFGVSKSGPRGFDEAEERHQKLAKLGSSDKMSKAREAINSVINDVKRENPDFNDMNDMEKAELIEKKLSSMSVDGSGLLGGETSERASALREAYQSIQASSSASRGMSGLRAMTLALATNQGGSSRADRLNLGMFSGAKDAYAQFAGIKDASKIQERAEEFLTKAVGADAASGIKSLGLSTQLSKALGDVSGVQAILEDTGMSTEEKAARLKNEHHIDVSSDSEIDALRKALTEAGGIKTKEARDNLENYKAGMAKVTIKGFQQTLRDASSTVKKGSDLEKALSAFTDSNSGGSEAQYKKVFDEVDKIVNRAADATSDKDSDAILSEAGSLGEAAKRARGAGRGIRAGSKMTLKDWASKFGISEAEAEAALGGDASYSGMDKSGKSKMYQASGEALKNLRKSAMHEAVGSIVKSQDAHAAGSKDEAITKALQDLNVTMKRTEAVIALTTSNGDVDKAVGYGKSINQYLDKTKGG